MSLTTDQKDLIESSIRKKTKMRCPMCGSNQWTLGGEIVSNTTVSVGGSVSLGGPFIPLIQLICNECGFTSHHALGALGVKIDD